MVETPQGDALMLWDTPGFGDSARLVKRLRQSGQPIGWLMSQVWDRWRDRAFWSSQQAMRNVRDEADVMLYLVNASEAPEAAGYVAARDGMLGWIGKPVVVLLNQLGAPREAAAEAAELRALAQPPGALAAVRAVLPLDAFARCWVQEATLAARDRAARSNGERSALMGRLRAAWQAHAQADLRCLDARARGRASRACAMARRGRSRSGRAARDGCASSASRSASAMRRRDAGGAGAAARSPRGSTPRCAPHRRADRAARPRGRRRRARC